MATLLKSSNDVFETHQCNAKLYLKTPTGMIYTTVKSFYWEHGANPRLESTEINGVALQKLNFIPFCN
jgi:hypothetical protein